VHYTHFATFRFVTTKISQKSIIQGSIGQTDFRPDFALLSRPFCCLTYFCRSFNVINSRNFVISFCNAPSLSCFVTCIIAPLVIFGSFVYSGSSGGLYICESAAGVFPVDLRCCVWILKSVFTGFLLRKIAYTRRITAYWVRFGHHGDGFTSSKPLKSPPFLYINVNIASFPLGLHLCRRPLMIRSIFFMCRLRITCRYQPGCE